MVRGGDTKPGTTSFPYRPPRHPRQNHATSGTTPERWLAFLGAEAPPSDELPIARHIPRPNAEQLPMMAKDVAGSVDYRKVLQIITNPYLKDLAQSVFRWLHDTTVYEQILNNRRRTARKVAHCSLQDLDFDTMVSLRKYEDSPIQGIITAWCRCFTVPEWTKNPPRRRHIGEPLLNDLFTETPTIHFLTRQQRHHIISQFPKGYALTLDLASFFDQIPLHPSVRQYFGINARGRLSRMRVLPMGFRPSAQIAQTITWAIIERAANQAGLKIITYLDNILILGMDPEQVKQARLMILEDAAAVGAVFNPEGVHDEPSQSFEFLGESFNLSGSVVTAQSSDKTVTKLNALRDFFFATADAPSITKRQLAATVGLCLFADGSGLDNNEIFKRFHALRYYSEQVSGNGRYSGPHLVDWDSTCSAPSQLALQSIRDWITELQANRPRQVLQEHLSSGDSTQPDMILYVDASEERWSYVAWDRRDSSIRTYSEPWTGVDRLRWNLGSSVSSEPLGACRSLCHAIAPGSLRYVSLYTDHSPLVDSIPSVCARTYTYWQLQKLCKGFRSAGTIVTLRHIPGNKNPADPGSRGIRQTPADWNSLLHQAQQHTMDTEDGENGRRDQVAQIDPEWGPTARNPTRLLHYVHEYPA
jgi:hypothetical protein